MSDETTSGNSGDGSDTAVEPTASGGEAPPFQRLLDGLRGNAAQRREAIDRLYRMFGPRIRQFMRRVTDSARAEDLANDVFVKILRSAAKFRGEAGQLPKWIWSIARRVRLDRLREEGREDFVDDEIVHAFDRIEDDSPGANPVLGSCVQRAIEDFIRKHPDRAECLGWIVIDGLSIKEIASVLDRTEHASRQYLFQCRKKLWALIGPCFGRASLASKP